MIKRKGVLATLVACVLAVTVVLAGCGASGGADAKAAFVGTWDVVEMKEGEEAYDSETLETMRDLGLDVYLELKEDGTASLVLFGESMDGTWEASSATAAKLTIEDASQDMTLADGKLTMEYEDSTITFEKGEARDAPASDDADAEDEGDATTAEAEEPVEFESPITLADDDVCTIVATGKADYLGDPAIQLTVTNKTDKSLYLTSTSDSFTVNGQEVDSYIGQSVEAGETKEAVQMWFPASDLDSSSLEDLKDIKGTIEVWDDDTNETLGTYEVSL